MTNNNKNQKIQNPKNSHPPKVYKDKDQVNQLTVVQKWMTNNNNNNNQTIQNPKNSQPSKVNKSKDQVKSLKTKKKPVKTFSP